MRIETLENIIQEKLNIINSLQSKLDTKKRANISDNRQEIESLYQAAITKKNKYKERFKRYKHLLRKRDQEIMDLVIESKELRT